METSDLRMKGPRRCVCAHEMMLVITGPSGGTWRHVFGLLDLKPGQLDKRVRPSMEGDDIMTS